MKTVNVVPFSSFLAGALMVKREISYMEIGILWTEFENEYNIEFMHESQDYNYGVLKRFFNEQRGFGFRLNGQYLDVDNGYGGKTVYECLYDFTNEYVREFFGNLPEKYDPDFKWERDNSNGKKRS